MISKLKARSILKQYGKAAYKQRIHYIDSMAETPSTGIYAINFKGLVKRSLTVIAVMILTLALFVAAASALGVKVFDFSFVNKADHTEVIGNNDGTANHPKDAIFYKTGYIPSGYTLMSENTFEDLSLDCVYQNNEGDCLYIEQQRADNYTANIDNENCTVNTKIIREMEIVIYDYGKRKTYMMQRDNTTIIITGTIIEEEFEKIIYGIQFN